MSDEDKMCWQDRGRVTVTHVDNQTPSSKRTRPKRLACLSCGRKMWGKSWGRIPPHVKKGWKRKSKKVSRQRSGRRV